MHPNGPSATRSRPSKNGAFKGSCLICSNCACWQSREESSLQREFPPVFPSVLCSPLRSRSFLSPLWFGVQVMVGGGFLQGALNTLDGCGVPVACLQGVLGALHGRSGPLPYMQRQCSLHGDQRGSISPSLSLSPPPALPLLLSPSLSFSVTLCPLGVVLRQALEQQLAQSCFKCGGTC